MTKVINLFGGPSVGKSTVAAGVFSELKQQKISVELVSEYAKDCVWEGTTKLLENQIHIFSEQFRRQFRLLNKVSYIVTDSPLLLSSVYFDYYYNNPDSISTYFSKEYAEVLCNFFDRTFFEFDNFNFYLERRKEYDPKGRIQTLDEAMKMDGMILDKLNYTGQGVMFCGNTEKQNIEIITDYIIGDNKCAQ